MGMVLVYFGIVKFQKFWFFKMKVLMPPPIFFVIEFLCLSRVRCVPDQRRLRHLFVQVEMTSAYIYFWVKGSFIDGSNKSLIRYRYQY